MSVHRSVLVCVSESVSVDGWACEHTGPEGVGCRGSGSFLRSATEPTVITGREESGWNAPLVTTEQRGSQDQGGSVYLSKAECT